MPPEPTAPPRPQSDDDHSRPNEEAGQARHLHHSETTTMGTEVRMATSLTQSSYPPSRGMRLPPILPLPLFAASPRPSPPGASGFPFPGGFNPPSSSANPFPSSLPVGMARSIQTPRRPSDSTHPISPGITSAHSAHSSPRSMGSQRGLKRNYDDMASSIEGSDPSAHRLSLQQPFDTHEQTSRMLPFPIGEAGSVSATSTPTGTTSSFPTIGAHPTFSRRQSGSSAISNTSRCSLHIRQQPRAARAGPDGRDRRPLDPPPVVQLLMNDFDPDVANDMAELRSSFFVVHCRLITAQSPRKDLSTLSKVTEDGSKEIQRLLLGTAVSSPFFCQDDPDPEHAPTHPVTTTTTSAPPSPSSRFIPPSVAKSSESKDREAPPETLPATFFIFADLSVRKAGEYRLEFSLMKMDAALMTPGSTVPIIHSITSQVFKVVNAKDFDQVQPSTDLVKGLLERGAGFPLKLKKGTREGQRRRPTRDGSEEEEDDDDDNDEEEDEDEG